MKWDCLKVVYKTTFRQFLRGSSSTVFCKTTWTTLLCHVSSLVMTMRHLKCCHDTIIRETPVTELPGARGLWSVIYTGKTKYIICYFGNESSVQTVVHPDALPISPFLPSAWLAKNHIRTCYMHVLSSFVWRTWLAKVSFEPVIQVSRSYKLSSMSGTPDE